MSRLAKLVVVVFVALCSGCAGTVVPLGSRGPAPAGAARTIEAEACGFQLLLLIPININGRAERAYRRLEAQAAGDFITNVQVRERWIWGFTGTSYCTALRATAIRVAGQASGAAVMPPAAATSPVMPAVERAEPVAPPADIAVPAAPLAPAGAGLPVATSLKAQPRSGSETLAVVPAGTVVSPSGGVRNGEGEWIYVQYGAESGWMLKPGAAR